MVSGYMINEGKSILRGLNVTQEIKWVVSFGSKAEWKTKGARYLGILISEKI